MHYSPSGICPNSIDYKLVNSIIKQILFTASFSGNTQGIAVPIQGMPAAIFQIQE